MRHFNKLERGVVMMVLTKVWVLTRQTCHFLSTKPHHKTTGKPKLQFVFSSQIFPVLNIVFITITINAISIQRGWLKHLLYYERILTLTLISRFLLSYSHLESWPLTYGLAAPQPFDLKDNSKRCCLHQHVTTSGCHGARKQSNL